MKINLTLICTVIRCNGSLNIQIFDQTDLIYTGQDLEEGLLRIDCAIDWPTTVNIITSNKGPNDTEVDTNGNIIRDKSIEVTGVLINNFPIHQDLIDKLFICQRAGSAGITNENWWGFNGTIKIVFDQLTPMRYMLALKNKFNMNRLYWDTIE
jgi:hypothetical protein